MRPKLDAIKRTFVVLCALVVLSSLAVGQLTDSTATLGSTGQRSELFAEGSGFFTKAVNNGGLNQQVTHSGGGTVGYRFHISPWNSVEARYGYTRNSQRYLSSTNTTAIQANVHEVTGAYVLTVPNLGRIQPFVDGGGGVLVFDPTGNSGQSVAGSQSQTKGTFAYGGGADFALLPRVSLRAEYRGLVYKAPDFKLTSLRTDRWTHSALPLVGVVFHF